MMSNGLLCHLVSVNDLHHDILSKDLVPVVNEFQDVFPYDFLGVSPPRGIDFGIILGPDTKPISIPPYRMVPAKLKELKLQLEDRTNKGFIRSSIFPMGSSTVVCEK